VVPFWAMQESWNATQIQEADCRRSVIRAQLITNPRPGWKTNLPEGGRGMINSKFFQSCFSAFKN